METVSEPPDAYRVLADPVRHGRNHPCSPVARFERTYASAPCSSCIRGAHLAVEMILDHSNPDGRKSRTEAFCCGPNSCRFYRPGPTRKVPGRRGVSFDEGDWVDEQDTEHRGPDH